jgi:plasmid stabilization system protein ParE
MPTVRRTPGAEHDLISIVDYIARDNLPTAVAWLEDIEALFRLLSVQPEMGEQQKSRRFKDARCHSQACT